MYMYVYMYVHMYVLELFRMEQKGKVSCYEFLIIEKGPLATERNLLLLDSTF